MSASNNDTPGTIQVELEADVKRALDRFVADEQGTMTREQAAAKALREWARTRVGKGGEGTRPENLNASNDD